MTSGKPFTRQDFDRMAAELGLSGDTDRMDELFAQVRGLMTGAESLRRMDVSAAEPDMAFIPPDAA